jgi:phosphate transport system permease protein
MVFITQRGIRKAVERFAEVVLFSSSTVTSLTVLLIILFLFREGLGIFSSTSVEENHVLVVHASNPVDKLTTNQISGIFNRDILFWSEVGGAPDSILLFTLTEIGNFYTEEELGPEFEFLPQKIDELVTAYPGMIAYFPEMYLADDFHGKVLPHNKIGVLEFFAGKAWYPTSEPAAQFGILSLILGTLWVTLGAILIALPIGLVTAIYIGEVAHPRIRSFFKPLIELLAGIPSVVYGFFGLVVLVPLIQNVFNLSVGETALAGSIVLAIMALPVIITISEDAIRTTPVSLKEASLALGASHWQTIMRVILPYARSGIIAAFILGIGRAIGETMAVLMVTGNAAMIPTTFLEPVRTIPATIAAELGEAPYGGTHFKALFALGIILFIITFAINTMVEFIRPRKNKS